jgi:hypothetical protein
MLTVGLVLDYVQNGVRGLMLDTYDFDNDVWLCHSFQGKCYNFTAFVRLSAKHSSLFCSEKENKYTCVVSIILS